MLRSRLAGILLFFLCVGILWSCLWPLEFHSKNNAVFLNDENAILFEWPYSALGKPVGGIAYTSGGMTVNVEKAGKYTGMTIELWLMPETGADLCPSPILSFYDEEGHTPIQIIQWRKQLILRTLESGRCKYSDRKLPGMLKADQRVFLSITSNADGTRVFADGKDVAYYPFYRMPAQSQSLSDVRLFLGNTPDVDCAWPGRVYGLALYDRKLEADQVFSNYQLWLEGPQNSAVCRQSVACYRFDHTEDFKVKNLSGKDYPLHVPAELSFVSIFNKPLWLSQIYIVDIILNIIGFLPFGFLFGFWASKEGSTPWRRCIILAFSGGFFLSLLIEFTQGFIPARDSSLIDLACNSLGALLGAITAWRTQFIVRNRFVT